MSVVLEELTICIGDGCVNRFPEGDGWDDRCPECLALWDDHAAGQHDPPWMDAYLAAERVFSETVLARHDLAGVEGRRPISTISISRPESRRRSPRRMGGTDSGSIPSRCSRVI